MSLQTGNHDKDSEAAPINNTKQRVADEVGDIKGLVWITSGGEVENYIPPSILIKHSNISESVASDPFTEIPEALMQAEGAAAVAVQKGDKIGLADFTIPHLTKEALETHRDPAERLDAVVDKIRAWNSP